VSDLFSPSDPNFDDPLLARIRTALLTQDARMTVRAAQEAREDLVRRLAEEQGAQGGEAISDNPGYRVPTNGATLLKSRVMPRQRILARWMYGIGAVVLLICLIAGIPRWLAHHHDSARGQAMYVTRTGERTVVVLPGGGRAHLAPRTTLRIASGFGSKSRTVVLDGEAYFEVPHTASLPFIVQTSAVTVRVLGTAFDVRAYAGDASTHVTVTAGRVAVASRTTAKPTMLTAGMTGIVRDSSAIVVGIGTEATAWITGQLAFRSVPTTDVLSALTRWYGYQFRVTDSSIVRQKVTIRLSAESSKSAFTTLERILEVDVAIDGNVVTLRPRQKTGYPARSTNERRNRLNSSYMEVGL
jgi:transmembrane sensor